MFGVASRICGIPPSQQILHSLVKKTVLTLVTLVGHLRADTSLLRVYIDMTEVEYFDGSRKKLPSFIGHLKLYFHLHEADFLDEEKKVLYAIQHLRGWAFNCFIVETEDYLNIERKNRKTRTKELFESFDAFEKRLDIYMGNPLQKARQVVVQG